MSTLVAVNQNNIFYLHVALSCERLIKDGFN